MLNKLHRILFGAQGEGTNYENRPTGNPAADYSEGASHVLAVIHQILNHHRALEQKWHAKKIKIHQRLALRLFQEDVKQVIPCVVPFFARLMYVFSEGSGLAFETW